MEHQLLLDWISCQLNYAFSIYFRITLDNLHNHNTYHMQSITGLGIPPHPIRNSGSDTVHLVDNSHMDFFAYIDLSHICMNLGTERMGTGSAGDTHIGWSNKLRVGTSTRLTNFLERRGILGWPCWLYHLQRQDGWPRVFVWPTLSFKASETDWTARSALNTP